MERLDHGFFRWLVDSRGLKEERAKEYERWVTVRQKDWPLDVAIQAGLCPPDRTLPELSAGQLYTIRRQSEGLLSDKLRTPLNMCLRYRAWAELSPLGEAEDAKGFCLSSVLETLRTALPAGTEDPRPLFLGALLLDPHFRVKPDPKFSPARDLRPGGEEWPVHRAAALWNAEHRREGVRQALNGVLKGLASQDDDDPDHPFWDLRQVLCQWAGRLRQNSGGLSGFEGSELRRLLLQMEGWQPHFSSGGRKDPRGDWYTLLTPEALLSHLSDTLAQLMALALRYEGRTLPPAVYPTGLSHTDQLYCCLLAPFDRLLTLTLCERAQLPGKQLARLLELGLLRVERVPYQNTSRLVSAGARLQRLPDDAGPGADHPIREVWSCRETRQLLLRLLDQLKESPPEDPGLLLAQAPELVALLAAAPPEPPVEEETSAAGRTETALHQLTAALEAPAGLSGSELDALEQLLGRLQFNQESGEAVRLLVELLVSSHWAIWQQGPSSQGMESLDRLISLYRKRPRTVSAALLALPKDGCRAPLCAQADLLPAWLLGRSAADALALAQDEARSLEERCRWANRAHSAGGTAQDDALRQGAVPLAVEASLTRARALALHAELDARLGRVSAPELVEDYLILCVGTLDETFRWLEEDLPSQKALQDAAGRPLPEDTPDRLRRALEAAASFCQDRFFASDAPARAVLEGDPAVWAALPHGCADPEQRQALLAVRLSNPARQAGGPASQTPMVPVVWSQLRRPARIFLPWYCSYLDSETCVRRNYRQGRLEAYLLKTVCSLQDVLLTANQVVDSSLIRNLAHEPGFLLLLRSGHIAVSFYFCYYSLRQYAAERLKNPGFSWSSLPADFNADQPARDAAARYLSGERREDVLPLRYRELMVRFKEDLILLDENLPSRWKAGCYQQPLAPGKPATLADHLDLYYLRRQDQPFFQPMCRLHFLLLRRDLSAEGRKKLTRSLYQSALDALRVGNLDGLKTMEPFCVPEVFQRGSWQRAYMESLAGDREQAQVLDPMQAILSDAQNRLLGSLCTEYQHHLYTEAERAIMPYDESSPINRGGCRIFQDTLTLTETGTQLGWEQAPEFLARSEALEREAPGTSAEQLASLLSQSYAALDYGISPKGDTLWLSRGILHTSTDEDLLVEMSDQEGTIHLETEGI